MSQQSDYDAEIEVDLFLQHISKTKKHIHLIAKQLFENNLNFGTTFSDETKSLLKNKFIEFAKIENQLKLQQQTSTKLQLMVI